MRLMVFHGHRNNGALFKQCAPILAGLILLAIGYGVANRANLTYDVLYRLAAGDYASALAAFAFLSAQACVLLMALIVFSSRAVAILLAVTGLSIAINLGYGQLVKAPLDAGSFVWLLVEARQARHAAGQFGAGIVLAGLQLVVALLLFIGARRAIHRAWPATYRRWQVTLAILLLMGPSLVAHILPIWPLAAERNIYDFTFDKMRAPPPPPRAAPRLQPGPAAQAAPRHIVWIIDESIAYEPFNRLIIPKISAIPHHNFGEAASLANCSSPAHVALRSGVDVRQISSRTDLRRTPSIWAYARKAGYRTRMIDGQATGAPQNMLLPPERALIDEYLQMAGGMDTDMHIARSINASLRTPARSFTYVVLRGVHFQYRDHYPAGMVADDAPIRTQYDTALNWSKKGFFKQLFTDVDRRDVAIIYTSDHGQNLKTGALPHCSRTPVTDEFRVPLLAFLPDHIAARYEGAPARGHSASQIFPATLIWMGYPSAEVEALYDHDLNAPAARYIWFGRKVIPLHARDRIEVHKQDTFPGTH